MGVLCCLNLLFLAGMRAISSSVLLVGLVVGFMSWLFVLGAVAVCPFEDLNNNIHTLKMKFTSNVNIG